MGQGILAVAELGNSDGGASLGSFAGAIAPGTGPVLIVMTDHHMGNLIISLPVINALASHFQEPPDLLVDERYAPLAALLPAKPRVLSYPAQTGRRRGALRSLQSAAIAARMPLKRYRAVFDVGGGTRSAVLSAATLARRRIGFAETPTSWLYSQRIERVPGMHVFDAYATMLARIGRIGRPPLIRLRASSEARAKLEGRLHLSQPNAQAPLAVIHAGAGKEYRQWPAERFGVVADELVRRHGMNICVIGSALEGSLMDEVIASMREARSAFALSLPLDELLALFERARILISNESGPTHLAAATDLPIVTIFGPSKEALWRPIREAGTIVLRGAECDPRCGKRRCFADRRCLISLETRQVLDAAERLLRAQADHPAWS